MLAEASRFLSVEMTKDLKPQSVARHGIEKQNGCHARVAQRILNGLNYLAIFRVTGSTHRVLMSDNLPNACSLSRSCCAVKNNFIEAAKSCESSPVLKKSSEFGVKSNLKIL